MNDKTGESDKIKNFININTARFFIPFALSFLLRLPMMFMFDAPGSEKSIPLLLLAYSVFWFPEAYLGSIGLAWLLYYLKKYRLARYTIMLPLVNIILFTIGLIFLWVIKW